MQCYFLGSFSSVNENVKWISKGTFCFIQPTTTVKKWENIQTETHTLFYSTYQHSEKGGKNHT